MFARLLKNVKKILIGKLSFRGIYSLIIAPQMIESLVAAHRTVKLQLNRNTLFQPHVSIGR